MREWVSRRFLSARIAAYGRGQNYNCELARRGESTPRRVYGLYQAQAPRTRRPLRCGCRHRRVLDDYGLASDRPSRCGARGLRAGRCAYRRRSSKHSSPPRLDGYRRRGGARACGVRLPKCPAQPPCFGEYARHFAGRCVRGFACHYRFRRWSRCFRSL